MNFLHLSIRLSQHVLFGGTQTKTSILLTESPGFSSLKPQYLAIFLTQKNAHKNKYLRKLNKSSSMPGKSKDDSNPKMSEPPSTRWPG